MSAADCTHGYYRGQRCPTCSPPEPKEFLIGQRVIISGKEIGVVEKSLFTEPRINRIWVFTPSKGFACEYDISNIQPLPNGQL